MAQLRSPIASTENEPVGRSIPVRRPRELVDDESSEQNHKRARLEVEIPEQMEICPCYDQDCLGCPEYSHIPPVVLLLGRNEKFEKIETFEISEVVDRITAARLAGPGHIHFHKQPKIQEVFNQLYIRIVVCDVLNGTVSVDINLKRRLAPMSMQHFLSSFKQFEESINESLSRRKVKNSPIGEYLISYLIKLDELTIIDAYSIYTSPAIPDVKMNSFLSKMIHQYPEFIPKYLNI